MTAAIIQGMLNRYLQRYLKNVTTEHATVWGGQLVFKNLELNLDVLQEEVGLPVVFQRGFIQELQVYLPLANLLREHISVTFSNVEIIACTPESFEVPSKGVGQEGQNGKRKEEKGSKKATGQEGMLSPEEEAELAQGWVSNLLNRVLQNIKVNVRNVVFKYVTGEYVSSVSFKTLSVQPTDCSWVPSFSDVEGPARSMFKEVKVEDATWSLDALEADGKIHRFQPPIFNREGLRVRVIARKLPDGPRAHSHFPLGLAAMQADVRSDRVCLTLSDSQLSMLLKLLDEVDHMVSQIKSSQSAQQALDRRASANPGTAAHGASSSFVDPNLAGDPDDPSEDDKLLSNPSSQPALQRQGSKGTIGNRRGSRPSKRTWLGLGSLFGSSSELHHDPHNNQSDLDSESIYGRPDSLSAGGAPLSGGGGVNGMGKLVVDSVVAVHVADFNINLTRSLHLGGGAGKGGWGVGNREKEGAGGSAKTSVFVSVQMKDLFGLHRSARAITLSPSGLATKVIEDARAGVRSLHVDFVEVPCTKGFFRPLNGQSNQPFDLDACLLAASLFRRQQDEDDKYWSTRPSGDDIRSESVQASTELDSLFNSQLIPRLNAANAAQNSDGLSDSSAAKGVDRGAVNGLTLSPWDGMLGQIPEGRAKEGAWPPNQPLFITAGYSTIVHRSPKKEEFYMLGIYSGTMNPTARPPLSPPKAKDTTTVQTPMSPNSQHKQSSTAPFPNPPPAPLSGGSQHGAATKTSATTPASLRSDGSRGLDDEDPEFETPKKHKGVKEGMLMQLSMAPIQLFVHPRLLAAASAYLSPKNAIAASNKEAKNTSQQNPSSNTHGGDSKNKMAKMLEQVPKAVVVDVRVAHLSCSYAELDAEDMYTEGTRSALCLASDAIQFSNLTPRPTSQSPIGSGADDQSVQRFGGLIVGVKFGYREVMIKGGEVKISASVPHFLNRNPVRMHLHASLEHAAAVATRSASGSSDPSLASAGLVLLSMTMEDMDLSMTYVDIQALLSASNRKNVYSASGSSAPQAAELVSITIDQSSSQQSFDDLMTIQLQGGSVQGQASVNGMQGVLQINRVVIKSKFMDLELPAQDDLIQISSDRPKAAFVVECFLPWNSIFPESDAVSLCRASGLGSSTGKLLASGMRGRMSMAGARFLGSAAELLPLVQLVAIRAVMDGEHSMQEKRKGMKPETSELSLSSKARPDGSEDGDAWSSLQEAMVQVRELQRENESLKERYSAVVAERHAAMAGTSEKLHPSVRGSNGKELENVSAAMAHTHQRRIGLGKVGGKMVSKGYWCWKRSRGGGDICRCIRNECGNVFRAIQMRPTVAALILYAVALHFVIAYLIRELQRKGTGPGLNSSRIQQTTPAIADSVTNFSSHH